MPRKSRERSVYEKLSAFDQSQVDARTGRTKGVRFTGAWPKASFKRAIAEVAGKPGDYTTGRGRTIQNARKRAR